MKKRTAFTLIEMLVVVAIIALLAAILFPAFDAAREKGKQSTCASNLKQIALAFHMYLVDYDSYYPWGEGYFPVGTYAAGTECTGYGYYDEVQPYIVNNNIWFCPTLEEFYQQAVYAAYRSHYGANHNIMCCEVPSAGKGLGYSETKINYPSTTVLLFDNEPSFGGGYVGSTQALTWACNGVNYQTAGLLAEPIYTGVAPYNVGVGNAGLNQCSLLCYARHTGGANYAFTDGHVKWYTIQDVLYTSPTGIAAHFLP